MYYRYLGYERLHKIYHCSGESFSCDYSFILLHSDFRSSWAGAQRLIKHLKPCPGHQLFRDWGIFNRVIFCQVSNQATVLANKLGFCLFVLWKPLTRVADVLKRPDFTSKPVWPVHLISLHLLSQCTWTKGKYESWQLLCLDRKKKHWSTEEKKTKKNDEA